MVRRYEVGDDEVHEVLARADDVEGLFAQARPLDRRELVVRGCPDVAALSRDFTIEVLDDQQWVWFWDVLDPVVREEAGRVVVTASAALQEEEHPQALRRLKQPRYRIFQEHRFVGWCEVEGLPDEWEGWSWPPVTLLGCDTPDFTGDRYDLWTGVRALDVTGRVMGEVRLDLDISEVRPRANGRFDVVLDQSCSHHVPKWRERPLPAAEAVWDLWRHGRPEEPGLWAELGTEERQSWLDLTFVGWQSTAELGPRTFHLDGRHVTDEPGLYLVLSEAFAGPGNYFGRHYDSFHACLQDARVTGSTLVWHNARTAWESIGELFVEVLELLHANEVVVELDFTPGELDRRLALGELARRLTAAGEHVITDNSRWKLDSVAAGVAVSTREDRIAVVTHSPAEVAKTLLRNGVELQPQRTVRQRGTELVVTGDDHLALGWERVADVVVARNDVWRVEAERRSRLTDLLHTWRRATQERLHVTSRQGRVVVTGAAPLPRKLMARDLADHPAPAPPDGYELVVTRTPGINARITHAGLEVARGRIAVIGRDAVPSDIGVELRHRRQGLGSALLGALVREAGVDGATTGVLISPEFGIVFFRALGWQDEADVVTTHQGGT
ncbi:hypothetical protein BBK82_04800 [Lentzea guizhouensis]|uniref:Barstar (barnase inhibitor) domain-containing protein n=1 Tax=Lentzea guizhouensis TaxID=1586287 RepID=A0A1B2HCQ3_9PSEU|nr:hypothetical protein BBK82_04800 [Lentzea guizhouensis]